MALLDGALSALAASQHGAFHRSQALDLGLTPRQIDARLKTGTVIAVHRGVYRMAAAAPSPEQAIVAACLAAGAGAVASHRAAAWLWRLRGFNNPRVEITVAGGRRPRSHGVLIHRTDRLERVDVTRRDGVGLSAPARTLVDLGAVVPAAVVEAALDDALVLGLVTVPRLTDALGRLAAPGRRGAGVLRAVLAGRGAGAAPTESELELALVRLFRRYGLPEPVRQHVLRTADGKTIRLDFAYPALRLAIEVDGRRWHSSAADLQRDRARSNLLVLLGWRMLVFTWDDVFRRPEAVAATVRREIAALLPTAG